MWNRFIFPSVLGLLEPLPYLFGAVPRNLSQLGRFGAVYFWRHEEIHSHSRGSISIPHGLAAGDGPGLLFFPVVSLGGFVRVWENTADRLSKPQTVVFGKSNVVRCDCVPLFCAGMGCTAIGVFGHGRKVHLDHFPLHDGTDGDHRCGQHRRGMAAHFAADPAALAGSCNTVPTPAVSLLVDAASAGVGGIHRGAAQFRLLRQPTPAWKLRHGLAGPASSGRWGNLAGGRPLLHGVIVALRIGGADLFPTYRHFGKRGEIMSIIFENVTKTIHGKTVLQGVTLSLETGRVTGLRGINGSGKTMLLRLLAGLIHPSEGKITIDGKTLGKDMEFPPSMGLLIENPAFLGQYTGAENLEMLASLHQNVAKEDVRTLLEKVGLAADGDTKYRKYSLGMKQRLGIAGAILGKPELLLLDEPTNALDTKGVELLREIIGEERQRGAAVVVACHEAAFLESVSDEIYCLENGQLTDHLILREKGGSKP